MLKFGGLSHEEAARIIGKHFSHVADKLLNILELKEIQTGNTELINASIEQKIKEIQLTPFRQAIDWSKTISYLRLLIVPFLIIILFLLSGNTKILSESTLRIINYNTEFTKPAPFYFVLSNDSLRIIENTNLTVTVVTHGEEVAGDVFINYANMEVKTKQPREDTYVHTFKNVQRDFDFYFSAKNEVSEIFKISTIKRPKINNFTVSIDPPRHTGAEKQTVKNIGSIMIQEGSVVKWEIDAENTDSILFAFDDHSSILRKEKNGKFVFEKKVYNSSDYFISPKNKTVQFIDSTFFNLKIIKDTYPSISIQDKSPDRPSILGGFIKDDFGFSELTFHCEIRGSDGKRQLKDSILIDLGLKTQSFIYPIAEYYDLCEPGDLISCYFIVRDNDIINNFKKTQSENILIQTPTHKESFQEFTENTNTIKNELREEIEALNNLKKELTELEKTLIEKDSLDWRDKKNVEEILNKQKTLEEKINKLQEKTLSNFEKLSSEQNKETLKKQKQLEKLFNEIVPDEMKDLYKELEKLKENLNKEELQKKLKELQLSNEDLEKELDRNLELLKQLEFEQNLEDLVLELKKLAEKQKKLSESNMQKEMEMKQQLEQSKKFNEMISQIQKLKSLNEKLENKHDLINSREEEENIQEGFKSGIENLEKGRDNRAKKDQAKTAEDLKNLSNLFDNMKKKNDEEKHYEDLEMLRQILENLIYFSLEEEELLLAFQLLEKNDPTYITLMHHQQTLRDAANIIEDSLFALSKRVPQLSSKINREINVIDAKTSSTINYLRERQTLKAVQEQQFIMTSANNLAVLLDGVLEQMQQDLANDLPSSQQCEKPGQGSPKPGDLKKMQKELNDHLKKMKQQMEMGEKRGEQQGDMSKSLVEMLAKQELIRYSLEELRKEMDTKEGGKLVEDVIEKMKENEIDIANKKITLESLKRQQQIMTKLLDIEDALREQGEDNKRESKSNTSEYERAVQEMYELYEMEKLKQTEMLKTTPPNLKNYYQQKVDRYFNLIIQ